MAGLPDHVLTVLLQCVRVRRKIEQVKILHKIFDLFCCSRPCHCYNGAKFSDVLIGEVFCNLRQRIEVSYAFSIHIQQHIHLIWKLIIFQPQAGIRWIGDSRSLEGAVDLLLCHRKVKPSDMLGILWIRLSGHRNGNGIWFVIVARKELTVVEQLHLHAVVVDHTIGCNRAATVPDKQPCRFLTVQRLQLVNSCAAAVQVHVVIPANRIEVREIRDNCNLLAAEAQVDKVLQLKKFQLMSHRLKLFGFSGIEAIQPFGEIVQLLNIYRKHLCAF